MYIALYLLCYTDEFELNLIPASLYTINRAYKRVLEHSCRPDHHSVCQSLCLSLGPVGDL